mgnify:FL=1
MVESQEVRGEEVMRKIAAKILFLLARVFLSRGMLVGQWCQNKAILLLSGVTQHRE